MRIALGCDDAAVGLMEIVRDYLTEQNLVPVECVDFGVGPNDATPYPDIAEKVGVAVAAGEADRGILVCGTGIGMVIVANKIPGIRAALAHDVYSAERARKSNDAQILAMGSRVIGPELAKSIVGAWLVSEFAGGRSAPKVEKVNEIDRRHRQGWSADSEETPG